MLDVTEILSEKWSNFSDQTVIRCWLKADILPRVHVNALKGKDVRLDREDDGDKAIIDDLCKMVTNMSMPARVTDGRSMPHELADNLFVEKCTGLSICEVRSAIQTWLGVEDDPEVLKAETALELQAVEQGIANLGVDGASSEQEDDDSSGSPESCMTSSLTEAEAHSCFEKLRAYLYTNGRNGEFSETLYLLSKSVHSFTHETQEKRRAKRGAEIQATLRDVWQA